MSYLLNNLSYDHFLSVYLTLTSSRLFALLHALWVAYAVKLENEGKPKNQDDTVLKAIVNHILLGFGGGMLVTILTGQTVAILTNNELLVIHLIGWTLINYTPVFSWLKLAAPVSEIIMDCYIDGLSRAVAMVFAIDRFKAGYAQAFIGQWLVGIIAACGGGVMSKIMNEETWELTDNTSVLAIASALYVYFTSRPKVYLFGYLMFDEDLKFIVAIFVVVFFVMRRFMDTEEAENKTKPQVDVPTPSSPKKKSLSAVPSPIKTITAPASPAKRSSSPTRSPSVTRSPVKKVLSEPEIASPVKTKAASPKKTTTPAKSTKATAVMSGDEEATVTKRRVTRGRAKKSSE